MAFYLKLFNKHSEYETYINDSDKILPNVSYCEDNDEVHFNPWSDPRLIAKFNVEDETEPVALYGADNGAIASELFSKIEIDGEEISITDLDNDGGYYTFEATGEHTVKYTLSDPEVISDYAFCECYSLISITIPNSVTSIGESAFYACSGLTSISVESGNTVYDSRNNCNAIIETTTNTLLYGCQNTIIPSGVSSIGDDAFFDCSGLTSINIPSGVTSIGDSAFAYCNIISITIPNSVTSIGDGVFSGCTSLTNMSVESGNTAYDSRGNCNAIIETVTNTLLYGCQNTIIPNSVTSIGDDAFNRCSGLTSINIPSGVTSIGESAFTYCSSLTSINIPSGVTSIGDQAFSYCSSLTSITIPNSVTSIGVWAFQRCSSLETITSQATTAPTISQYTFAYVKTGGTLYVPTGSTGYNVWMGNSNY